MRTQYSSQNLSFVGNGLLVLLICVMWRPSAARMGSSKLRARRVAPLARSRSVAVPGRDPSTPPETDHEVEFAGTTGPYSTFVGNWMHCLKCRPPPEGPAPFAVWHLFLTVWAQSKPSTVPGLRAGTQSCHCGTTLVQGCSVHSFDGFYGPLKCHGYKCLCTVLMPP